MASPEDQEVLSVSSDSPEKRQKREVEPEPCSHGVDLLADPDHGDPPPAESSRTGSTSSECDSSSSSSGGSSSGSDSDESVSSSAHSAAGRGGGGGWGRGRHASYHRDAINRVIPFLKRVLRRPQALRASERSNVQAALREAEAADVIIYGAGQAYKSKRNAESAILNLYYADIVSQLQQQEP